MSEYNKIQHKTLGTKIGSSDIISGVFFLKFVKEYHAYDRKQKEIITNLQEEINQLNEENKKIAAERDRYMYALSDIATYNGTKNSGIKDKVKRQRSAIANLLMQVANLKEQLKKANESKDKNI